MNEGLKKYSHVNKKAVEQWNNFTKQRDQLIERRAELESSADSIQELIDVLDQRKDEAIERTFKQVSRNFEDVFEKLVPAGRGRLIMQRRIDQAAEDEMDIDDDDAEPAHKSTIDNYTGVSIKASAASRSVHLSPTDSSFTGIFQLQGRRGTTSTAIIRRPKIAGGTRNRYVVEPRWSESRRLLMKLLSSVFAIQKCDPAPFYLFDEIDANLDAQYRTAVAGKSGCLGLDSS